MNTQFCCLFTITIFRWKRTFECLWSQQFTATQCNSSLHRSARDLATSSSPLGACRCKTNESVILYWQQIRLTCSFGISNAAQKNGDEPLQRILVHGIDVGQVRDAEEQNLCVHGDGDVQTARFINVFLRLFGDGHLGLKTENRHGISVDEAHHITNSCQMCNRSPVKLFFAGLARVVNWKLQRNGAAQRKQRNAWKSHQGAESQTNEEPDHKVEILTKNGKSILWIEIASRLLMSAQIK